MASRPLLGQLGARLVVAFTVVALGAIGLLAALAVVAARGDGSSLARDQQQATESAVAYAAATADRAGNAWLDPGLWRAAGRRLRDALLGTGAVAAGLAGALGVGVAVAMSRRITRPVVELTAVARAMEGGDRDVRVSGIAGTGEIGELASAFNQMADTLSREDDLRRAVVADVAHELRTPVTVLQASTEALRDGVVEATASELSSLHDEVVRLGRMVEDLQTLASAEAAGMRLERRDVDLADVAGEAVDALRQQFDAAELRLTT